MEKQPIPGAELLIAVLHNLRRKISDWKAAFDRQRRVDATLELLKLREQDKKDI